MGTPKYMSPEQIRGKDVRGPSDQFSLAVLAYQMLTGRMPFTGHDDFAVCTNILQTDPPPPTRVNPLLPLPLDSVLRRALAKAQYDRFRTCSEFAEALDSALFGRINPDPEATRRTTVPLKGASKRKTVLAGIVFAVLAVLAIMWSSAHTRLPSEPSGPVASEARAVAEATTERTPKNSRTATPLVVRNNAPGRQRQQGRVPPPSQKGATLIKGSTRSDGPGGHQSGVKSQLPSKGNIPPLATAHPAARPPQPPTRSGVGPQEKAPNVGYSSVAGPVPSGGGVGSGEGGSFAPADARPGGGVYRVGGGVSNPTLVYKVEAVYSERAQKAKVQGTVLLYLQVDPSGKAINMRVLHSLGLGLDEKAMEAVKQWKFRPGLKDGTPVTVEAQVEVNFRLL